MYTLISILLLLTCLLITYRLHKYLSDEKYKFLKILIEEENGGFEKAMNSYKKLISPNIDFSQTYTITYDALIRYSLLSIKSADIKHLSDWITNWLPIVLNSPNNDKKDEVIFNYCLLLAESKNYKPIADIMGKHFSDKSDNDAQKILSISGDNLTNQLNQEINKINDLISDGSNMLSALDHINSILNDSVNIPDLKNQLSMLEPYVLNSLISGELDVNEYPKLFYYLINSDNFTENLSLLNNAAILAERIVFHQQLTESNFKDVISVFITALYNDVIFLDKLKDTVWDDEYYINLDNSLGYWNFDLMPYEDLQNFRPNESKGSIDVEETRQFLLEDISNSLLKLNEINKPFFKLVSDFFDKEKDSIVNAIENLFNLSNSLQLCFTPYFGSKYNLTFSFINSINNVGEELADFNLVSALPFLYSAYAYLPEETNFTKISYLFSDLDSKNKFIARFKTIIIVNYLIQNIDSDSLDNLRNLKTEHKKIFSKLSSTDQKKIEGLLTFKYSKLKDDVSRIEYFKTIHEIIPSIVKLNNYLSYDISHLAIDLCNSYKIDNDKCFSELLYALKIDNENYHAQKNIVIIISKVSLNFDGLCSLMDKVSDIKQININELNTLLYNSLHSNLDKLDEYLPGGSLHRATINEENIQSAKQCIYRSLRLLNG